MSEFVPDSIVQTIIERFKSRAEFGYNKYQTNLDRTDLSPDQWAQHALEEMHDGMLYIQKWKQEQEKQKRFVELLYKLYDTQLKNKIVMNNMLPNEEAVVFWQLEEWYQQHTK